MNAFKPERWVDDARSTGERELSPSERERLTRLRPRLLAWAAGFFLGVPALIWAFAWLVVRMVPPRTGPCGSNADIVFPMLCAAILSLICFVLGKPWFGAWVDAGRDLASGRVEMFEAMAPDDSGSRQNREMRLPSCRDLSAGDPWNDMQVDIVAPAPVSFERVATHCGATPGSAEPGRALTEPELVELRLELEKCARRRTHWVFYGFSLIPSLVIFALALRFYRPDPDSQLISAVLLAVAVGFGIPAERSRRRKVRESRDELEKLRADLQGGVVLIRTGVRWVWDHEDEWTRSENPPEIEYELLPNSGRRWREEGCPMTFWRGHVLRS